MPIATASPETERQDQSCNVQTQCCYAVMTRHDDGEILLSRDRDCFSIPAFEIPQRQRVAPNLLSAIQTHFGFCAVCRFSLPVPDSDSDGRCVVLEVLNDRPVRGRSVWIPVPEIEWNRIEPPAARDILWKALARATAYNAGLVAGRFVRPGWLEEVLSWARACLASHSMELRGAWSQYNMGPDYSLISLDTDGRAVWFKAVGEANLREFSITKQLADLRLPHLPPLLAVHRDWHAWLMFDCGANFLDGSASRNQWEAAARGLAELQVASVSGCRPLAEAGCQDLRMPVLRDAIEPFLSGISVLMRRQQTVPPRRLNINDLRLIERWVKASCRDLEILGIPDSLGHSDLNSGNVLFDDGGSVFIDWMQGHLGHPFLTFEYLLALNRRLLPADIALTDALRQEYLGCWRDVCSVRQLKQSLKLIPLVAPLAYALSCHDLREGADGVRPELAALLRSLARRMRAEAERLECSMAAEPQRTAGNLSLATDDERKRSCGPTVSAPDTSRIRNPKERR